MFNNKMKATQEQNIKFARRNFVHLIHGESRMQGLTTTIPQTKTIIEGYGVSGVSLDDTSVIVQLKRAWNYILQSSMLLNVLMLNHINKLVALYDSLQPGQMRTGKISVDLADGNSITLDRIPLEKIAVYLNNLLNNVNSDNATDTALSLATYIIKNQLYWDGNKRTALLAANKIMITYGVGLLDIPIEKTEEWNNITVDLFKSGNDQNFKTWLYHNAIKTFSFKN